MKKTYHLCLSAGKEAMFRDTEDYHRGFNCFALALYKTESIGLGESIMSTHTHQLVQTAVPIELMIAFRQSYAKYFNHKYLRRGRLGENMHFSLEVVGYHHMLAALTYVLRNALHHGVVPIPYAYPHCSVNAVFREAMGKFQSSSLLPANQYYRYVGRRAQFPDKYKMTESGVFLRETVLDIPQVENLFVTPRAFNYYMSRKSSEEWENEQSKDGSEILPISLPVIEKGVDMHTLEKMLVYENGRADYRRMSDIELCTYLDEVARKRYGRHSVYQLTHSEKVELAEELFRAYHMSDAQIRRGLAFFD